MLTRTVLLTVTVFAGTRLAAAQQTLASADRGAWVPAATSTIAAMQRRIAVDLRGASLREAIDQIAQRAGMIVGYSNEVTTSRVHVSLHVDGISVAQAVGQALMGTGLTAYVSVDGMQMLVRAPLLVVPTRMLKAARLQQAGGSLVGRATDAATHIPLDHVAVRLDGLGLDAVTASDGRYVIHNVPLGTYRVTARRVGYTPLTRPVTVAIDSATTVDFALVTAATKLDEVVTTAVGDAQRVEVGNAIATIHADSIGKTAPIASLTDLMSGRVANVQILESSGVVGAGPRIRIRGLNSAFLSNDPILIVDGVRVDGSQGVGNDVSPANDGHLVSSRFNDLDPQDVESIEVLRGPSAATEYGTDAANGVIVVKTKHGRAGPPRWDIFAERGVSTIPTHFPSNYYAWGHTTDGAHTPAQCPVFTSYIDPTAPNLGAGTCAIDSITSFNPLATPSVSPLGTGSHAEYNVRLSGGNQQTRYSLAAGYTGDGGVLHLPSVEAAALRAQNQSVPAYEAQPNTLNRTSLHGNTTSEVGSNVNVVVNAGYVRSGQRSPNDLQLFTGAITGAGYRDTLNGYAASARPRDVLRNTASDNIGRFTGGVTATWRPQTWLTGHGTVGLDADDESQTAYVPIGPDPTFNTDGTGYRGVERTAINVYTVDVGAVATATLTPVVGAKTAVGVQYTDQRRMGTLVRARGLAPGGLDLTGAVQSTSSEIGDQMATFGSYIEETVSYDERLFLTGALRVDAGSGFGQNYQSAVYPKASASWVLMRAPHPSIRLRAAYGQSGVQPARGASLSLYGPTAAVVGGVPATGDTLQTIGNAALRPERQTELEGGADIEMLRGRVSAEVTLYNKESRDAIVTRTFPLSVEGGITQQENLGSVRNRGIEASVTGILVDARPLAWNLSVSGSVNTNKLITLGRGIPPIIGFGYRDTVGYPIYGWWAPQLHFVDSNHDGIIEPNEVTVAPRTTYQGSSIPTREASVSTDISIFDHRVHVATQFDYRGGHKLFYILPFQRLPVLDSREENDPRAPLLDQARDVAFVSSFVINSGQFAPADFVRWRELSLTYAATTDVARFLRARAVAVTLAARNLALWTRYAGPDPEVNNAYPGGPFGTPLDAPYDQGGLPLARSWALRVTIGL